jgi:glutamate racemase
LAYLKSNFDLPIIGVIAPGVQSAITATKNHQIGVLGTHATIRSDAYGKRLLAVNGEISVVSQACPLFVPLAEEGWVSGDVPESVAKNYLSSIIGSSVDTVILGCTHYPLLKPVISDVLGENVQLVDSGQATATAVHAVLEKKNLLADETPGEIQCFATDSPESFEALAGRFLKATISSIQHIDIS